MGDKHLSELCRGTEIGPIYTHLKNLVPSDDEEMSNAADAVSAPYLHGVWGYRDADGRTAFHWAVAMKNFDLATTLMNEPYCSPVLTVDEDMSTPFATACTVAAPDEFLDAVLKKSIVAYSRFCRWRDTLPNVIAAAATAAAATAAAATAAAAAASAAGTSADSATEGPTSTVPGTNGDTPSMAEPAPTATLTPQTLSEEETKQCVMDLEDEQGNTCFLLSVSRGHLRVVRWLLKQGAILTHQNRRGQSSLHRAVSRGAMEMVEELVRASEKLNTGNKVLHRRWMNLQDGRGDTALFYASMENNEEVGKYLLRHGADRDMLNQNGKHFWEV